MTWANNFIRFCTFDEVKKEALKRGILSSPQPPPIILGEISSADLYNTLPSTFINPPDGKEYFVRKDVYMDSMYHLTSVEEVKRWLKWNLIDKEIYIAEDFDCDDFAVATWGSMKLTKSNIVFGLALVPGHAKNWFMDEKKQIWEAEPQSDTVSLSKGLISHYFL